MEWNYRLIDNRRRDNQSPAQTPQNRVSPTYCGNIMGRSVINMVYTERAARGTLMRLIARRSAWPCSFRLSFSRIGSLSLTYSVHTMVSQLVTGGGCALLKYWVIVQRNISSLHRQPRIHHQRCEGRDHAASL